MNTILLRTLMLVLMCCFLCVQSVCALQTGDTVEVVNTNDGPKKGLLVRKGPCGQEAGSQLDGAIGTVVAGPETCSDHVRWEIEWCDGVKGWSAEGNSTKEWLRHTPRSCAAAHSNNEWWKSIVAGTRLSSLHGDYVDSKDGFKKVSRDRANAIHLGIDIAAPSGTPIHAIASGEVIGVQSGEGNGEANFTLHSSSGVLSNTLPNHEAFWVYGNGLIVKHDQTYGNPPRETYSAYMHMRSAPMVGNRVEVGEKIGEVGNTGGSHGNHLHLEIRHFSQAFCPDSADLWGFEGRKNSYANPRVPVSNPTTWFTVSEVFRTNWSDPAEFAAEQTSGNPDVTETTGVHDPIPSYPYVVTARYLKVLEKPSDSGRELFRLAQGDRVQVRASAPDWTGYPYVQIDVPGRPASGWVNSDFLEHTVEKGFVFAEICTRVSENSDECWPPDWGPARCVSIHGRFVENLPVAVVPYGQFPPAHATTGGRAYHDFYACYECDERLYVTRLLWRHPEQYPQKPAIAVVGTTPSLSPVSFKQLANVPVALMKKAQKSFPNNDYRNAWEFDSVLGDVVMLHFTYTETYEDPNTFDSYAFAWQNHFHDVYAGSEPTPAVFKIGDDVYIASGWIEYGKQGKRLYKLTSSGAVEVPFIGEIERVTD